MMFSKEEAKQANDEIDLSHAQDAGIDQRFAERLAALEANPDLSFMRSHLEDQDLLVERDEVELVTKIPKKWVTFRANSPEIPEVIPVPVYDYDDDEADQEVGDILRGNSLRADVIFEIKRNIEELLILNQRQRELQEHLRIAGGQSVHDGVVNLRVDFFARQLNDIIIPIQVLGVAIGGLRNSLKAIAENGIERTLVAAPDRDDRQHDAIRTIPPSFKRD